LLLHFQYRCLCVLLPQIYGAPQEGFVFKWALSLGYNFVFFKVSSCLIFYVTYLDIIFVN
jgi:hypothetical protein